MQLPVLLILSATFTIKSIVAVNKVPYLPEYLRERIYNYITDEMVNTLVNTAEYPASAAALGNRSATIANLHAVDRHSRRFISQRTLWPFQLQHYCRGLRHMLAVMEVHWHSRLLLDESLNEDRCFQFILGSLRLPAPGPIPATRLRFSMDQVSSDSLVLLTLALRQLGGELRTIDLGWGQYVDTLQNIEQIINNDNRDLVRQITQQGAAGQVIMQDFQTVFLDALTNALRSVNKFNVDFALLRSLLGASRLPFVWNALSDNNIGLKELKITRITLNHFLDSLLTLNTADSRHQLLRVEHLSLEWADYTTRNTVQDLRTLAKLIVGRNIFRDMRVLSLHGRLTSQFLLNTILITQSSVKSNLGNLHKVEQLIIGEMDMDVPLDPRPLTHLFHLPTTPFPQLKSLMISLGTTTATDDDYYMDHVNNHRLQSLIAALDRNYRWTLNAEFELFLYDCLNDPPTTPLQVWRHIRAPIVHCLDNSEWSDDMLYEKNRLDYSVPHLSFRHAGRRSLRAVNVKGFIISKMFQHLLPNMLTSFEWYEQKPSDLRLLMEAIQVVARNNPLSLGELEELDFTVIRGADESWDSESDDKALCNFIAILPELRKLTLKFLDEDLMQVSGLLMLLDTIRNLTLHEIFVEIEKTEIDDLQRDSYESQVRANLARHDQLKHARIIIGKELDLKWERAQ